MRTKDMKQKLVIIALFTCLMVLAGCTNTTPPSDTLDTANWQTYQNDDWGISFKYPEGWDVLEDDNLGILVNEVPFPEPFPPDYLRPSMVMDTGSLTNEKLLAKLQRLDPLVSMEIVDIGGRPVQKYSYKISPDNEQRYLYRFPRGEQFIEVGVDGDADLAFVQQILKTLSY